MTSLRPAMHRRAQRSRVAIEIDLTRLPLQTRHEPSMMPRRRCLSARMPRGTGTRWSAIQTGFVDEPRKAVEEADALVAEVMKRLAEIFADERGQLESQWERTEQISTEDLRLAMRRYRSFFERLLSV